MKLYTNIKRKNDISKYFHKNTQKTGNNFIGNKVFFIYNLYIKWNQIKWKKKLNI